MADPAVRCADAFPVPESCNARTEHTKMTPTPVLAVSGSFKARRRGSLRPSLDSDEFINLLHGSDPVKVELNRLENEVRDKGRELGEGQAEIKALKSSERLRERAVEEVFI